MIGKRARGCAGGERGQIPSAAARFDFGAGAAAPHRKASLCQSPFAGSVAVLLRQRFHLSIDALPYTHIVTHIMKTTLELPDDLLMEAKATAVRRRTTLRAIIEHALRRELSPSPASSNPDPDKFEMGPLGFLVLKRKPSETITLEQIQELEADAEQEELERALKPRRR